MKSNESVCAICMPFQVGLEVVREIPTATLISLEFFHTTGVLDTGELCVAWRGVAWRDDSEGYRFGDQLFDWR